MKIILGKIYVFWWFVCFMITTFLIFDIVRPFDYIVGNYKEDTLMVNTVSFPNSTSRADRITVYGHTENQSVYLSEFDDDMKKVYVFLNPTMSEDYTYSDDLTELNILMPIIKFKHSNNVILIPKGVENDMVLRDWFVPLLLLFLLAYAPIAILFFILKADKTLKRQSN